MNARGGLYIKYNNRIRYYRCKGLIEATPKRTRGITEQSPDEAVVTEEPEFTIETVEVKREKSETDEYNSWINIWWSFFLIKISFSFDQSKMHFSISSQFQWTIWNRK